MDSKPPPVVATEDVVHALIDHLVDPILPLRSSSNDPPPLATQQSVADQMHAVVLLYNYYHRRQFPQLEFLDFESFCKLAIISKSRLLVHMKFMQRCGSESDGLSKLSVTEKAIMDACIICKGLDAAQSSPSMDKGWPISKVAVFLIDSAKQNCVLLFSAITQGVWSLIEKHCDKSNAELQAKKTRQEKNGSKKPLTDHRNGDDTHLQNLALLTVKETTGTDLSDLMVLESHIVYSLSEEKSAARFYIMKCNKSFKEDVIQVPIEDAINSLRGPLLTTSGNDCMVTPVVEYFHLLPYAGIVKNWLSRKMLPNDSQLLQERQGSMNKDFPRTSEPFSTVATEKFDGSNNGCQTSFLKKSNTITRKFKQEERNEFCVSSSPDAFCGPFNMDEGKSSTMYHISEKKNTTSNLAYNAKKNSSVECDSSLGKSGFLYMAQVDDLVSRPYNSESIGLTDAVVNTKIISSSGQSKTPEAGYDLIPFTSSSQKLDKVQAVMASKGNELLHTSLRVLVKKRNDLTLQQRHLDDEIARCEKKIQTVLSGGEDDLMLQIDSIIEACNDGSSGDATGIQREANFQLQERSLMSLKRKRLSEAILHLRNPCQELDDICCENNWILPRYSIFPSDEGFHANVMVQGIDFGCSGTGDLRPDPHTARDSAAKHVLNKLRHMASHGHDLWLSKN